MRSESDDASRRRNREGAFSDLGANNFILAMCLWLFFPDPRQPTVDAPIEPTEVVRVTLLDAPPPPFLWGIEVEASGRSGSPCFMAHAGASLPGDMEAVVSPPLAVQANRSYDVTVHGAGVEVRAVRVFFTDAPAFSETDETVKVLVHFLGNEQAVELGPSKGWSARVTAAKTAPDSRPINATARIRRDDLPATLSTLFDDITFKGVDVESSIHIIRDGTLGLAVQGGSAWLSLRGTDHDFRAYLGGVKDLSAAPLPLSTSHFADALWNEHGNRRVVAAYIDGTPLGAFLGRTGERGSFYVAAGLVNKNGRSNTLMFVGLPHGAEAEEAVVFLARYPEDDGGEWRMATMDPGQFCWAVPTQLELSPDQVSQIVNAYFDDERLPVALGPLGVVVAGNDGTLTLFRPDRSERELPITASESDPRLLFAAVCEPDYRILETGILQSPLLKHTWARYD